MSSKAISIQKQASCQAKKKAPAKKEVLYDVEHEKKELARISAMTDAEVAELNAFLKSLKPVRPKTFCIMWQKSASLKEATDEYNRLSRSGVSLEYPPDPDFVKGIARYYRSLGIKLKRLS